MKLVCALVNYNMVKKKAMISILEHMYQQKYGEMGDWGVLGGGTSY